MACKDYLKALGFAVTVLTSGQACAAPMEDYVSALDLFDEYRYAEGSIRLRTAANGGHVLAQRTLGLMLLHGSSLYGHEVRGDRQEAELWLRRAAADGCEVSRIVLGRLAKPRQISAQLGDD